MNKFLLGTVAGMLVTVLLFLLLSPHPESKSKPIKISNQGSLSGTIKIGPELPSKGNGGSGQDIYIPPPREPSEQSKLMLGDYKIPVSGELATESNLGKVKTQLNGFTIVTIGESNLKVDTQFSGSSVVDYKPPDYHWRIYTGMKTDFDQVLPDIQVSYTRKVFCGLGIGAGVQYDSKIWLGVGVEYRF